MHIPLFIFSSSAVLDGNIKEGLWIKEALRQTGLKCQNVDLRHIIVHEQF